MTMGRSRVEKDHRRAEPAALAALDAHDFDTVVAVVAAPRGPKAANGGQEGDSCWQSTRST